jgi:intracellular sulfur oxidation DsrE/DsrF family protein
MLKCLIYIVSLCVLLSNPVFAEDDFFNPTHKVVIQVNSGDSQTQHIALNNAINLQKAYGIDDVTVEVVAYGPGLSLYTNSSASERVPSLAMQNITFSLCSNTLEKMTQKLGETPELVEGVGMVPFGVVRIVELQEQGYAYVRP